MRLHAAASRELTFFLCLVIPVDQFRACASNHFHYCVLSHTSLSSAYWAQVTFSKWGTHNASGKRWGPGELCCTPPCHNQRIKVYSVLAEAPATVSQLTEIFSYILKTTLAQFLWCKNGLLAVRLYSRCLYSSFYSLLVGRFAHPRFAVSAARLLEVGRWVFSSWLVCITSTTGCVPLLARRRPGMRVCLGMGVVVLASLPPKRR